MIKPCAVFQIKFAHKRHVFCAENPRMVYIREYSPVDPGQFHISTKCNCSCTALIFLYSPNFQLQYLAAKELRKHLNSPVKSFLVTGCLLFPADIEGFETKLGQKRFIAHIYISVLLNSF